MSRNNTVDCVSEYTQIHDVSGVKKIYKHFYHSNKMMLVSTDNHSLHCTPNHPVLTRDGKFVPAHLLKEGQSITVFDYGSVSHLSIAFFYRWLKEYGILTMSEKENNGVDLHGDVRSGLYEIATINSIDLGVKDADNFRQFFDVFMEEIQKDRLIFEAKIDFKTYKNMQVLLGNKQKIGASQISWLFINPSDDIPSKGAKLLSRRKVLNTTMNLLSSTPIFADVEPVINKAFESWHDPATFNRWVYQVARMFYGNGVQY